ncbi:MAG: ABC transporter permease [Acidobacteriia bacterium]|nr:ABC transporter permease [Terriglobia bacterium]
MDALLQDIRYAIRQLRKSPGLSVLAILTLAVGIGANTAMFTLVESVLIRPLPYANADRMVSIGPGGPDGADSALVSTSWLNYTDIRDQSQTLSAAAGYSEDVGVVQGQEGSLSLLTPGVTPNLLPMIGARPLLGRTFSEEEGKTGGPRVVLLSEGLWRQAFGADPQIVGRTIRVNALPRTVIGVMPRSFRFPESVGPDMAKGLWLPLQPTSEMLNERGYHFFFIVAQMKPGVSVTQLRGDLNAIAQRIRQADPKSNSDFSLNAGVYQRILTGDVQPVFIALLVALGLVLLIACANVANLLIARCLGRQQEFAVRAALGAGQLRLMRQLFVEGGLLSIIGCVVGLGLAELAIVAIHKLPAGTIPRAEDIAVRWTVVVALAMIATLTTLLSSLLPALLVARTDPQPALQAASRGTGSRSVRGRLSGWLIAGEVALSTLLLISTGLLFRTLWNLEHARLGFDITRVTAFTAMPADAAGFGNLSVTKESQQSSPNIATLFYQPVIQRLQALPGFQDAALVTAPPFSGVDMNSSFTVVGVAENLQHGNSAKLNAVSGGYARVMGTPIVRGRMISEDDTAAAPFVMVVNEAFAHKYFPDQDPLGRQLNLGGADTGMIKPYTIAGVIGDQVDQSVSTPPKPMMILPYQQIPPASLFYPALLKTLVFFTVKTRSNVAVAPAARSVFKQVAPDFALDNFQTMQESFAQSNFNDRLGLYLIGAFAGMAMLMVIAGLYGVLAQLVSYRRREIGIRLALGATRGSVLTMILRQGTVLVMAGVGAGIVLAVATGKLAKAFLYGVKPVDAWTYLAVTATLAAVGTVAALIPARRAAAVEPIEALRDE